MQIDLNISSPVAQGMKVERVVLVLVKTGHNLKIWTSEVGFTELWVTRVFLTKDNIHWENAHYWLKRFFSEDSISQIFKIVQLQEEEKRKKESTKRHNRWLRRHW